MNEYLSALLLTYTAFLFAVLSPGPNVFGMLNVTLERGRTTGILFGLGIAFGSLTWATLTVIGLTQLVAKVGWILMLIKVLGGFYLLYLAVLAFRSSLESVVSNQTSHQNESRGFFGKGYLLMMTNPKAALAWVAIVSLSTFGDAPFWVPLAAVCGTFSLSIIVHVTYAFVFSNRHFVSLYGRMRSKILKAFSLVYGGLGIKLLTTTH